MTWRALLISPYLRQLLQSVHHVGAAAAALPVLALALFTALPPLALPPLRLRCRRPDTACALLLSRSRFTLLSLTVLAAALVRRALLSPCDRRLDAKAQIEIESDL
jgi:hypothetical protein